MSFTNLIDYDSITMIQGVDGIRLCEESWMKTRFDNKTEPLSISYGEGQTLSKKIIISNN